MSSATPQQKLAHLAELFVKGNLTESGLWAECLDLLIPSATMLYRFDKISSATQFDEAEDPAEGPAEDPAEDPAGESQTHQYDHPAEVNNEDIVTSTPFNSRGKVFYRVPDSDVVTDEHNTNVGKIGDLNCLIIDGEDPWTNICTDNDGNTYEIASPNLQALTGFGQQRWRQAALGGGCYILRNGLPIYKARKKENDFIKAVGLRIRNNGTRTMVECINRVAKSGAETVLPIDWNVGGGTTWRMGAEGKIN
jgi:hypothetical protein